MKHWVITWEAIGHWSRRQAYRLLAVCLLLACYFDPRLLSEPSGVHITVLPAGQGDASVFEFPTGEVMLIDGGPREEYLLDFLKRKQISKIHIMVLSHPDLDHLNGLLRVLEVLEVQEIWHSGFDARHDLMRKFLYLANQKKIPIKIAQELLGKHSIGNAHVHVLAPARFDEQQTTNNNSLVLKVSLGEDSALWAGDIESQAELQASAAWRASVLKAPHHGSKSSSSEHFVKQVTPKHVIFCTQAENNFGFPNLQIKKRWENIQAKTWDTGTKGKIQVVLTGKGVVVWSYL